MFPHDKVLISVALCTHNGARFIGEQMRSICLQTLPPSQIVLSDDASTDDGVEVAIETFNACARLQPGLHINLRVLRNEPALRVTKNFEAAVSACDGKYIALCDQDDVWDPRRLALMAAQFDRHPELLLLHSNARLVGVARQDLGDSLFEAIEVKPLELAKIHAGHAFDVLLRRNLVTGATTMFRKSLLKSALPFPRQWLHDEWLAIVASAIGRIDVLEDELIEYRQHDGNQIGARRDSFLTKVQKAFAARGDTHVQRAVKAELLLNRLLSLGSEVKPDVVEKVRSKLEHQRFRAALPTGRMSRLLPVVREAMTGRYEKFGRGVPGVVRDLFESV